MSFEAIDNLQAPKIAKTACPENGMRVSARTAGRPASRGGGKTAYIVITIGAKLAKALSLSLPEGRVRVLFGSGPDAPSSAFQPT